MHDRHQLQFRLQQKEDLSEMTHRVFKASTIVAVSYLMLFLLLGCSKDRPQTAQPNDPTENILETDEAPEREGDIAGSQANPEAKDLLTQLGLEPLEFDSIEKSVTDCIKKFNSFHLKSKIKIYKKQRNEANMAGQTERSNEINRKIQEMYSALTH